MAYSRGVVVCPTFEDMIFLERIRLFVLNGGVLSFLVLVSVLAICYSSLSFLQCHDTVPLSPR